MRTQFSPRQRGSNTGSSLARRYRGLKIEKVSFNFASEASYVYILSNLTYAHVYLTLPGATLGV